MCVKRQHQGGYQGSEDFDFTGVIHQACDDAEPDKMCQPIQGHHKRFNTTLLGSWQWVFSLKSFISLYWLFIVVVEIFITNVHQRKVSNTLSHLRRRMVQFAHDGVETQFSTGWYWPILRLMTTGLHSTTSPSCVEWFHILCAASLR